MKTLPILLFLYSLSAFQDIEWEQVVIDEYASALFPPNYKKTDTLGQIILDAESEYSIIMLSVTSQDAVNKISSENINFRLDPKELNEMYDGVIKGFAQSFDSVEITMKKIIKIDSLIAIDFETTSSYGEVKRVNAVVVRDKMYLAQVWYHQDYVNEANIELVRFFNSLTFSINPKDQLIPENPEDSWAYLLGKLLGYALIGSIILIAIFKIANQKPNK